MELSHASQMALAAAGYGHLDPENAIESIGDFLVEAIEDNRANNTRTSIKKDWSNWNGAANAISVYEDGPNGEKWAGSGIFDHQEIYDAVERYVDLRMEARIEREFEQFKSDVKDAPRLSSLLDALESADEYAKENDFDFVLLYDATELPVFGDGEGPSDTDGIYSWDTENILVKGNDGWEVIRRS